MHDMRITDFWTRACTAVPGMPLILEWFELVYPVKS